MPFGLPEPPPGIVQKPPGISLCMIVKNEERFLAQCLRSVSDVVDEIIVVDTGSTDRTIEIARSFGAKVIEREWRNDFAWARNQSLELATKRWILALDADEELTPESKPALEVLKTTPAHHDAIWVRFLNQSDDYRGTGAMSHALIRIFPNDPAIRYRGLIHEFPSLNDSPSGLEGRMAPISIVHHGYLKDVVESRNKGARNLEIVKAAAEREPEDAFHWFNLGSTAFLTDDFELARDALEQMRRVNAGEQRGFLPNGLAVLAEVYCDKFGDAAKGEEVARDCLRVAPHYANAHFQLGKSLVAQGRFDEARQAYLDAIADGEHAHLQFVLDDQVYIWKAHSEIGSSYVLQGDEAKATEWFEKGLRNAPGVEPLLINLARSLDRQCRFDEAERRYREAYEKYHSEFSSIDLINFLLRQQRGAEAIAIVDEVHASLDDTHASAVLLAAAQVAANLGLPFLPYLEAAAKRTPGDADVLNQLEQVYRDAGNMAALESLLAAEAAVPPKSSADFLRRSHQALRDQRYEDAREIATRGLERDKGNGHLRYNRALALTHLGKKEDAVLELAAIDEGPADLMNSASLLRATIERDLGRTDDALLTLGVLLDRDASSTPARTLRASILEAAGEHARAESDLRAAAEIDPGMGAVELASFYLRLGRFAEAAAVANRALG